MNTREYIPYKVSGPMETDNGNARERDVEAALVRETGKRGGRALKFVSPGLSGVPDRIILLPGGRCAFVELKRPGGKMRPLQEKRKRQLEELGFCVFCVDKKSMIGGVLDAIQSS